MLIADTMTKYKVFIIEEDMAITEELQSSLPMDNYDIIAAVDGSRVVQMAVTISPDLIILASRFKEFSGFDICRSLRREMMVPILMIGSRDEEIDSIVGLELGADDYLARPFGKRELIARIRAMLRHRDIMLLESKTTSINNGSQSIEVGDFKIDLDLHKVSLNGAVVDLSPKEFRLLSFLVRNRGRVFSREQLLNNAWSYDFEGDARTVDVRIRSLRQKIEDDPANPVYILTVRGFGYQFRK